MKKCFSTVFIFCIFSFVLHSQSYKKILLPLADFENWHTRVVRESFVVGGDSCDVFYIAPQARTTAKGKLNSRTPWASSNVYAEAFGVTKVNVNVFPEKGLTGKCAAIKTSMMTFKVLGLTLNVVTAGGIYTGSIDEPVKSIDNAYAKIDMGIPFATRPHHLYFDYKSYIQNSGFITRATGFNVRKVAGVDKAQVFVLMQKRWEKDGKIYAKRVGTAEMYIDQSTDWVKGHKLKINYGKPASDSIYSERCKLNSIFYADNAQGKRMVVEELDWAQADEKPTHMILHMTSGWCGLFAGEVGNALYVDNIGFAYPLD